MHPCSLVTLNAFFDILLHGGLARVELQRWLNSLWICDSLWTVLVLPPCERKMTGFWAVFLVSRAVFIHVFTLERSFRLWLKFQRTQRIAHNFKELNASLTISKKSTDYSNMAPNSYQASISSQPSKPYDPLPGGHQKYQYDRHIDASTCHQAVCPSESCWQKPYLPIPSRY